MPTLAITPEVVRWAIGESGLSTHDLSSKLGADVAGWLSATSAPSLSELRKLAEALRRPLAAFFLPRPPANTSPPVEFRHPLDTDRASLNVEERRVLREVLRQQRILSWVVDQLHLAAPSLPSLRLDEDPLAAATRVRELLGVSVEQQLGCKSAATAFGRWREALEELGLFVFLFPVGKGSFRGCSAWDEHAPVLAINTAWNVEARIFSLFHELGHLVTRTSSACVEGGGSRLAAASDPAERWCESFAASVLVPVEPLTKLLHAEAGWKAGQRIGDLEVPKLVARRFKVSLRAAALRLIQAGFAGWDLYQRIPPFVDGKAPGGGPGKEPRTRGRIHRERYGQRATSVFVRAIRADVLTRGDVLGYLDVSDQDLEQLESGGG